MKKNVYKNEEVKDIILAECGIIGFSWINEELDFDIQIDWNGQSDLADDFDFMETKAHLVFHWITELKIMLDYKDQIKASSIESFSFKKNEYGYNININCNFDSIGYINFNCYDFYFEIIENI